MMSRLENLKIRLEKIQTAIEKRLSNAHIDSYVMNSSSMNYIDIEKLRKEENYYINEIKKEELKKNGVKISYFSKRISLL